MFCYDRIAVIYFNMQDLYNAEHYQQRALNEQTEPEDSRIRRLATNEVKNDLLQRQADRLVGIHYQKSPDYQG